MDGEDAWNRGEENNCFLLHIYVIRDALHKSDGRIETFRNVIRKRSWHL